MAGIFNRKPSDAHVVWRSGRDDGGRKRFDWEYLELWAAHYGYDYEEWDRVDHERSDEPRRQHVCVFARTSGRETELSLGGESWTMGTDQKPRTFVEIDEAGLLRLRGWETETTVDVDELVVDGATLKLKTASGATRSLDTATLRSPPADGD